MTDKPETVLDFTEMRFAVYGVDPDDQRALQHDLDEVKKGRVNMIQVGNLIVEDNEELPRVTIDFRGATVILPRGESIHISGDVALEVRGLRVKWARASASSR